jgi:hypothetical protein
VHVGVAGVLPQVLVGAGPHRLEPPEHPVQVDARLDGEVDLERPEQ